MKLRKKRNFLLLFGFLVILGLLLYAILYEHFFVYNNTVKNNQKFLIQYCDSNPDYPYCDKIYENGVKGIENRGSYGYIFEYVFFNYNSTRSLLYIYPLVIIIIASYMITKLLQSGVVKNVFTRIEYRKYIKKEIIQTYIPALIIPISLIIFIIICFIFSDSALLSQNQSDLYSVTDDMYNFKWVYFIIYITNIILFGIFICNLTLIVARKGFNYIINVVLTFFLFCILKIALSTLGIFLDYFVQYFKINIEYYLFVAMDFICFQYGNVPILFTSFYFLILVLLSELIVYKMYNKEEGLVMCSE